MLTHGNQQNACIAYLKYTEFAKAPTKNVLRTPIIVHMTIIIIATAAVAIATDIIMNNSIATDTTTATTIAERR